MTHKNKILLVTGIADTFFSPASSKKLEYGNDIVNKIHNMIDLKSSLFSGFINLIHYQDSSKNVNVFSKLTPSKVLNYKLFNPSLFDVWNNYTLVENKTEAVEYNASSLDHLLPPDQYEIHICGVDLNGFYKDLISELLNKGYSVYLYSDLIKRFKNTESGITNIRNKSFSYCSYKSVN
jgi:hypothetical protein